MILLGFSSPSDRESINQTCLILLDYDLSIFFEQVIFQAVHSFASMTVLVVASMAVLEKSVSRLRVSSPHLTRLKKGIHPQTITEAYHRAKMDRLDIVSSLLILLLAVLMNAFRRSFRQHIKQKRFWMRWHSQSILD